MTTWWSQARAESVEGWRAPGGDAWRSAEVNAAERRAAEALLLEHLDEIGEICEMAGRRGGLSRADVEDFSSWARLRLIDNDYAMLRRFRASGEFGHFVSVVIYNLLRDYRTGMWGKWRPSAAAKRQSSAAEHLERLVWRDGFSVSEAVEIALRADHLPGGAERLQCLAEELRARHRPEVLGGDLILSQAGDGDAEERLNSRRRRKLAKRLQEALAFALGKLEEADQRLLRLYFEEEMTLSRVATLLGVPPRSIYRRRDRCLRLLRAYLENLGYRWLEVKELLGKEGCDLGLDRLARAHPDPGISGAEDRFQVDAA